MSDFSYIPEAVTRGTSITISAPPVLSFDPNSAEEKRRKIYNVLSNAAVDSFRLEQSWIRLGLMLAEFKGQEHWRPLGYVTFDSFMDELKVKFNRGRTQLWGYLSVAEHLLPTISAADLEKMGIAKALELKRAKKLLDGKPISQDLINKALAEGTTTKELRGDIAQALNLSPEPTGTWFDMDGFFMDPTERKEFKEIWHVAEGLLGLKKETPEHIRRKEVILTCMREWYGTHAAEFYGDDKSTATCAAVFMNPHSAFKQEPFVPQPIAVSAAVITPEVVTQQHVDCPCWETGTFVRVDGCSYHPWDF